MARWSEIRAVMFDVGGTLIRPWPSVGHVYARVAARHGLKRISAETLNHNFARAWRAKRDFNHSRSAWLNLVENTFAGAAQAEEVRHCFDDLYDAFARPAAWRVFDDVRPALRRLRQRGFRLGVISNWDERLRPLLDRLRLVDFFEVMVISHEVGCTKPSKEIFLTAARLLRVPPATVLHIGDREVEDRRGAEAAGLRGLRLERGRTRGRNGVITSLDRLDRLLEMSN